MPSRLALLLLTTLAALWAQTANATWPEIGPNDLRITYEGGSGSLTPAAWFPKTAVNALEQQVLIVFLVREAPGFEIAGQFVDFNGRLIGPRFFIGTATSVERPQVSFSPTHRHFLVVWPSSTGIQGRLVSEAGALIGTNLQPTSTCDPCDPSLTYNSTSDEFLLVYADGGQIWSQRIEGATGEPLFSPTAVSQATGMELEPHVVYNGVSNEYLVSWTSRRTMPGQIYVQRLDGAAAGQLGTDDLRISDMGSTASRPAAAHNPENNEYLLAWVGGDPESGLDESEIEIFCQRLSAAGDEVGADDFRISAAGGLGDPQFLVQRPQVAYSQDSGLYLVIWWGEHDQRGMVDDEFEIFGQFVASSGQLIGPDDFRISDAGDSGDPDFLAGSPVVAVPAGREEFMAFWYADDNVEGMIDDEREIFLQRLDTSGFVFNDDFESGSLDSWSESAP